MEVTALPAVVDSLAVGGLYSNEQIYRSLEVSNAGGIRPSIAGNGDICRLAVMTSVPGLHTAGENPYFDRLEDGFLTYTAAGRKGTQTLSGSNIRITEQKQGNFPIHGFALTAHRKNKSVGPARWRYVGLLEYLRHYPDNQLDVDGSVRKVWLFEFKIHRSFGVIPLAADAVVSADTLAESRLSARPDDDEIVPGIAVTSAHDQERLERVRRSLLQMEPRRFELFVKDLLVHCGFQNVCVTKYSSDGGVDVNATAGSRQWAFEDTLVQVQAKRWLHSVGRKEVAELRGSLRPFARGTILTTSHFSKAAINEASEEGKNPIGLLDGTGLAGVILSERFPLNE
jgi:HJR/Mrr/RecB family endonuclease